jgi:hypothetical protein
MTRKISGSARPPQPQRASVAKPAVTAKPAAKPKAKPSTGESTFPRATWKDQARLGAEIERSRRRDDAEHPKLRHARPARPDPIAGGEGSRPPIAMRYGVIRPDRPPIAMRYGVIRPDPGTQPTRPPIAMRYGVIRPDPDTQPTRPPVAMRYGVVRPDPDTQPTRPPIAMRYGVIRPPPADDDKRR